MIVLRYQHTTTQAGKIEKIIAQDAIDPLNCSLKRMEDTENIWWQGTFNTTYPPSIEMSVALFVQTEGKEDLLAVCQITSITCDKKVSQVTFSSKGDIKNLLQEVCEELLQTFQAVLCVLVAQKITHYDHPWEKLKALIPFYPIRLFWRSVQDIEIIDLFPPQSQCASYVKERFLTCQVQHLPAPSSLHIDLRVQWVHIQRGSLSLSAKLREASGYLYTYFADQIEKQWFKKGAAFKKTGYWVMHSVLHKMDAVGQSHLPQQHVIEKDQKKVVFQLSAYRPELVLGYDTRQKYIESGSLNIACGGCGLPLSQKFNITFPMREPAVSWASKTSYTAGVWVHQSGVLYRCQAEHRSGDLFEADDSYWMRVGHTDIFDQVTSRSFFLNTDEGRELTRYLVGCALLNGLRTCRENSLSVRIVPTDMPFFLTHPWIQIEGKLYRVGHVKVDMAYRKASIRLLLHRWTKTCMAFQQGWEKLVHTYAYGNAGVLEKDSVETPHFIWESNTLKALSSPTCMYAHYVQPALHESEEDQLTKAWLKRKAPRFEIHLSSLRKVEPLVNRYTLQTTLSNINASVNAPEEAVF